MERRRRLKRVGTVGAALTLLFIGSLAFNAATDANQYPGPLDFIRRYPWLVLLALVPVAVFGLWPHDKDGEPNRSRPSPPRARASTFRLPPRNTRFVGRDSVLADLARGFRPPVGATVQILHGMAGLGKTQTSIEYAYRSLESYEFIGFIDSERPELLNSQFVDIASELGLTNVDRDRAVDLVYEALADKASWLLIFDNAEHPSDYHSYLPRGRAEKSGHAIVTTRNGGWSATGRVLDLDLFQRAESVTLLRSRALREASEVDLDVVSELLGDLPIAIEQAAAYMDYYQVSPREYISMLKTRLEEMLRYGDVLDRPGVVVATLWNISLRKLAVESPAAVQLLQLCSVLAPQPVPLGLFLRHRELLHGPLAAAAADEQAWAMTVGAIVAMSLARRDRDGIILHRLEQAAIRSSLDRPARVDAGRVAAALLEASTTDDVEADRSVWPVWQSVLVHMLAIADDTDSHVPLSTTGTLLQRAARYLRVTGSPIAARPLAERAASIHEEAHGGSAAVLGTDLMVLARILRDAGQLKEARPFAERALNIHIRSLGNESPEVGFDLIILAQIVRDLGDLASALGLAERAFALHSALLGPSDSQVAFDLTIMARVLRDLGRASDALPYAMRALKIDEERFGPRHHAVGTDLTILARVYHDLGERDLAVASAARALEVMENAFGTDHPEVATALTIMAQISTWIGNLGAAKAYAERALSVHERTYHANHPYVGFDLVTLCEISLRQNDLQSALQHAKRAVEIFSTAYYEQHPFVGHGLTALARAQAAAGEDALAQATAQQAVDILEAKRGHDHPWTRKARELLNAE